MKTIISITKIPHSYHPTNGQEYSLSLSDGTQIRAWWESLYLIYGHEDDITIDMEDWVVDSVIGKMCHPHLTHLVHY